MTTDDELTRAARSGDAAALATLLERHRAGMRAVALSLLGHGPDAEDAVQEAMLIALRRIGDVRDPSAVGPWLRMVTRNACRARLRAAARTRPVARPEPPPVDGPEGILERHALRDWLWHAIDELSPPLRMAVLLRHFSAGATSYQAIAAVCGVPVGTVRSRLHQAHAKLASALAGSADAGHDDIAARNAASRRDALDTLAAAERGDFERHLVERWSPDVGYFDGGRRVGDRDFLVAGMEGDLTAGVRQRLVDVVVGRDLTIWEMDLVNPADHPDHCPPAVSWVMSVADGRVSQLRLFHAPQV